MNKIHKLPYMNTRILLCLVCAIVSIKTNGASPYPTEVVKKLRVMDALAEERKILRGSENDHFLDSMCYYSPHDVTIIAQLLKMLDIKLVDAEPVRDYRPESSLRAVSRVLISSAETSKSLVEGAIIANIGKPDEKILREILVRIDRHLAVEVEKKVQKQDREGSRKVSKAETQKGSMIVHSEVKNLLPDESNDKNGYPAIQMSNVSQWPTLLMTVAAVAITALLIGFVLGKRGSKK